MQRRLHMLVKRRGRDIESVRERFAGTVAGIAEVPTMIAHLQNFELAVSER